MGIISIEQKELRIKGGNILSNVEWRRKFSSKKHMQIQVPVGIQDTESVRTCGWLGSKILSEIPKWLWGPW